MQVIINTFDSESSFTKIRCCDQWKTAVNIVCNMANITDVVLHFPVLHYQHPVNVLCVIHSDAVRTFGWSILVSHFVLSKLKLIGGFVLQVS